MTPRLLALVLVLTLAPAAEAGLRPAYGGELTVVAPALPQEFEPARAWSVSEVVAAGGVGVALPSLLASPPTAAPKGVRLTLREGLQLADGTVLDAKLAAALLTRAFSRSVVALPPVTWKHPGALELFAATTLGPAALGELLRLPWTRLARDGAFVADKTHLDAHAGALEGRALLDRVKFEARDGRRLEPAAEAIVFAREGGHGRPVLALPRSDGPGASTLRSVLARLDRPALARLFVRGLSTVPAEGSLPVPAAAAPVPKETLIIAVDMAERDLRTVGERLQILLRDRKVTSRVVVEERAAWRARLARREFDLALVALPPAPEPLQALTFAHLAEPAQPVGALWSTLPAEHPLRATATRLGAQLLYVEGGGVTLGARVRGVVAGPAWSLELADAWLVPAGLAP